MTHGALSIKFQLILTFAARRVLDRWRNICYNVPQLNQGVIMELVKELKEGDVRGNVPRTCCGGLTLEVTPEDEQK